MKRLALSLLPLAAAISSATAAPMDPTENPIAKEFTVDVQRAFHLYGDTLDPKLVWYVAKQGMVALNGTSTGLPQPRFSVYSRMPWNGVFAGENLVYFGGAFDTTGNLGDLNRLQAEAHAKGMTISPAKASSASTKFLATGFEVGADGRVDTKCEFEEWTAPNGNVVLVPICEAMSRDGEYRTSDFMYQFRSAVPRGNSSTSEYIPFQGTTMPGWDFTIGDLMATGSNWDANLQGVVEWELTTEAKTRVARIVVDWKRTFEQASTFTALHNWSCVDIEIQTFFRRLVDNPDGNSGITVEYLHPDGIYRQDPVDDAQFHKVVDGVYQDMRNELFNEMRDYGQSQLGPVNTEATAVFTMRANYEKLIFERNETRYIAWNPGTSITNANTNMTVSCVKGGFGMPVVWDMDTAACRDLAGL